METVVCPELAACLLGLAIAEPQPLGLALGVTTITDVQTQYRVIDCIGTSYTGGPVLNLNEWEVGLAGLLDVQLAFSAAGVLDVVTVKVEKSHLGGLLRDFASHLPSGRDDSWAGNHRLTFASGGAEIVVESSSLDSRFVVDYSTEDFRFARSQARKLYATA